MAKSPSIRTNHFPPYHPISLSTLHAFPQDCPVTPKGVLMAGTISRIFPFALHHRGLVTAAAARTNGHQPRVNQCTSPRHHAFFHHGGTLSRVRGAHQVWSYLNLSSSMVPLVLHTLASTRGRQCALSTRQEPGPLAPAPWRSFPRGACRVFSLELVCS